MDILNDQEKAAVAQFLDNAVMREAVRKVLLAGIYDNGVIKQGEPHNPAQNFALFEVFNVLNGGGVVSDADIGQVVRAKAQGIKLVEQAFKQLESYKPKKSTGKGKGNPAL